MKNCYDEGFQAFHYGENGCPYNQSDEYTSYQEWTDGWLVAYIHSSEENMKSTNIWR